VRRAARQQVGIMASMMFDEILARIQKLQDTINASPASQ
jgi:hypothetical protein